MRLVEGTYISLEIPSKHNPKHHGGLQYYVSLDEMPRRVKRYYNLARRHGVKWVKPYGGAMRVGVIGGKMYIEDCDCMGSFNNGVSVCVDAHFDMESERG